MSRFTELLKRTNERLELPQPAKSRILLEIASDMDDMYHFFIDQGLSERDAAVRVNEKFEVSDDALQELIQVHESPIRKFLSRFSDQAQTRWERVILVILVLFVAGFSGPQILSGEFFDQVSGFVWPAVGISFVILIITIQSIYRLYIKKDHNIKTLRSGLPWLLALSCASLLNGFAGYTWEMYRASMAFAGSADINLVPIVQWGINSSAMVVASLWATIVAVLSWFVLMGKAKSIEIAEAAWLLERE
jgi:hypothetical protein